MYPHTAGFISLLRTDRIMRDMFLDAIDARRDEDADTVIESMIEYVASQHMISTCNPLLISTPMVRNELLHSGI